MLIVVDPLQSAECLLACCLLACVLNSQLSCPQNHTANLFGVRVTCDGSGILTAILYSVTTMTLFDQHFMLQK